MIRKAFSEITPLGVVAVRLYVDSPLSGCPPLRCYRTVAEVSEEEGSYASRFYRWFSENFRVVFYFSWLRPV